MLMSGIGDVSGNSSHASASVGRSASVRVASTGSGPSSGAVTAATSPAAAPAPAPDGAKKADQPQRSPEQLAAQLNAMLQRRDSQVRFEIDRTSQPSRVITQIVDKDTKEVLLQFPSEDMVRISESMDGGDGSVAPLVRTSA
jgi:uncharacterized FlaG/YvyC family protein